MTLLEGSIIKSVTIESSMKFDMTRYKVDQFKEFLESKRNFKTMTDPGEDHIEWWVRYRLGS